MASLYFDGDKRRVYEVPDNSSFSVDGDGYRVYTPNDLGAAETLIQFTAVQIWTAYVDFHDGDKWTTLAFDRAGGQYRDTIGGVDVYAVTELRFINEWAFVPANYKHKSVIEGNVLPDITFGDVFDAGRLTEPVETKINFADRGAVNIVTAPGTSDSQDFINDIVATLVFG